METQNRFKSKVLWAAIAAEVISLCQLTGLFTAIGLDAGLVGNIVAGLLQVLVLVGVLNNPSDPVNF
jgi:uncharacterized membrane protein